MVNHGRRIRSYPPICPDLFDSENNAGVFSPPVVEAVTKRTPVKRLGQPDDLKAAVVFLASPGSKFTTGHSLVVDGGWTVW